MIKPRRQDGSWADGPRWACGRCGAVASLTARFCEQCGEGLQRPSDKGADVPTGRFGAPEQGTGERRLVTVLFCDLVDSTAMAAQRDVEDVAQFMRTFQTTCADAIGPFGGFIAQTLGDGMMVYFGFPEGHEGDAERAVHAGLAIVEAVSDPRGALRGLWNECAVRIGIHTGVVFAGVVGPWDTRADKALVGDTPAIAARLQPLASRNHVVVGPKTQELVEGHFDLKALGPQQLKGLRDPMPVWEVQPHIGVRSRFAVRSRRTGPTVLVGRGNELTFLRKRWTLAMQGYGQIVVVTGNAGIGKSRLVEALRAEVEPTQGQCLRYQCSPFFQHTALYPFVQQLRDAAGIHGEDPDGLKLEKLERLLETAVGRVEGDVELLSQLLRVGNDGAPTRHTAQRVLDDTVDLLIEQLVQLAERRPLLIVLEDGHWMDHTTRGLVRKLRKRLSGNRIFVAVTDRVGLPELPHDREGVSSLELQRLQPESCVTIVEQITAGTPLPRQVVDRAIALSDGVPFFVEELAKAVLESREAGDVLSVPLSLRELLSARLDRTGEHKLIAQLGACIGRTFSYELLMMISDQDEGSLRTALQALVEADLVERSGDYPHASFTFRHALIQTAAHESILMRERAAIHALVAYRLQQSFPRICEGEPEVLAYHMREAGSHEAATRYWYKAARAAQQRSAHVEAIAHLDQALSALQDVTPDPESKLLETEIQIAQAHSHTAGEGWGGARVTQAYRRALELSRAIKNAPKECQAFWGMCANHMVRGEFKAASETAEQYLTLAERTGDRRAMLMADAATLMTHFCLGQLDTAQRHADRIHALYQPDEDRDLARVFNHDPEVLASVYEGFLLWVKGYPDRAAHANRHAVERAKQLDHTFLHCYALANGMGACLWRGELDQVAGMHDQAMTLSREGRMPVFRVYVPLMAAPALMQRTAAAELVPDLEKCLIAMRRARVSMHLPLYLTHFALAQERAGDATGALESAEEALRALADSSERWVEPEIRRIRARLLSATTDRDRKQEESELRTALRQARGIGARAFELRIASDLCQLLLGQGRRTEAKDLLSPVLAFFREGLGTQDLRRARELLDQSSS